MTDVFRCATLTDAREFCDVAYDTKPREFFFDRNGDNFSSILGKVLARHSELHGRPPPA